MSSDGSKPPTIDAFRVFQYRGKVSRVRCDPLELRVLDEYHESSDTSNGSKRRTLAIERLIIEYHHQQVPPGFCSSEREMLKESKEIFYNTQTRQSPSLFSLFAAAAAAAAAALIFLDPSLVF